MSATIVEDEAELVAIARDMRTVAVVGIKDGRDPDAPGFTVPEMMKASGLRIIGVNPTIPSTLGLLLVRLLGHGMPLDAAIDAPRVHHGFVPDQIRYEAAHPLPPSVLDELTKKGHRLYRSYATQGDVSALVLSGAQAFGYADSREGPGLALAPPSR